MAVSIRSSGSNSQVGPPRIPFITCFSNSVLLDTQVEAITAAYDYLNEGIDIFSVERDGTVSSKKKALWLVCCAGCRGTDSSTDA